MSNIDQLKKIRDTLKKIDHNLRQNSLCSECGKPQHGILPAGRTREDAGFCLCETNYHLVSTKE